MMTELENKFTVSLDTIYKELTRDKITITKHLKKNYKLDIHYIIVDTIKNDKQHGGHNKITYIISSLFLTKYLIGLDKNKYYPLLKSSSCAIIFVLQYCSYLYNYQIGNYYNQ